MTQLSMTLIVFVCSPLPSASIIRMGSNVAAALSFMHSKGYIHSNLKPDNVGVPDFGSPNEVAKLLDLGLVKCATDLYVEPKALL